MNYNPKHILSTKNLDGAIIKSALADNIFIECIPYIEIVTINSPDVENIIEEYVVFTSKNAVESVAAHLTKLHHWKIFCLSGATKQAVEKYFPQNEIIETADNAWELAEKIVRHKNISSVTFFCGNKRLNTLPDLLEQNNIAVNELIVYETQLTPQKTEKDYDGILFFSPSAVESFFSVNKIPELTVAFAIGSTTAKALEKHAQEIVISPTPDAASLLEQIRQYANR